MEIAENIARFARLAERYCAWAEVTTSDPEADMKMARTLLAELHVAALGLDDTGCGDDTEQVVSYEDWHVILERFQTLPIDLYWDVFEPLKEEPPVLNSLSDDLADIYRDIKVGMILYKRGNIVEAVWEWRFNFHIHWGAHLTGAQRAIHSYLADKSY